MQLQQISICINLFKFQSWLSIYLQKLVKSTSKRANSKRAIVLNCHTHTGSNVYIEYSFRFAQLHRTMQNTRIHHNYTTTFTRFICGRCAGWFWARNRKRAYTDMHLSLYQLLCASAASQNTILNYIVSVVLQEQTQKRAKLWTWITCIYEYCSSSQYMVHYKVPSIILWANTQC